jgi:hypothetical protein
VGEEFFQVIMLSCKEIFIQVTFGEMRFIRFSIFGPGEFLFLPVGNGSFFPNYLLTAVLIANFSVCPLGDVPPFPLKIRHERWYISLKCYAIGVTGVMHRLPTFQATAYPSPILHCQNVLILQKQIIL